jgi:hypothetical protein
VVFKAMFPPKGKMSITAPDNGMPGMVLPVSISFIPGEDLQPNQIRAELVGEEVYYRRRTHTDSHGTHMEIVKKSSTFANIVQVAAEQPALSKDMEQKWNVSLQIPQNAHPTCTGKITNVHWTLKVVMDVPKRIDMVQEKAFFMYCPPPQEGAVTSADAQQAFDANTKQVMQEVNEKLDMLQQTIPFPIFKTQPRQGDISPADSAQMYNDIALTLKVPGNAKVGETLVGQLTLDMKDQVSLRGIRVELVQSEDAGAKQGDTIIVKTSVSESVSYNQGESPSLQFFLSVPNEAQPTTISSLSSLRWLVRAVLDRPMKKDFFVDKEVYIYNGPDLK